MPALSTTRPLVIVCLLINELLSNLTSRVWVSKDWALMVSFIQARNVTLSFKPKNREPVTALNNFNLDVARGEFVSIVGPSGCGKSTFLNILLGLIAPDTGEMQLNGTRITGPSQERAMVFQEFGLLAVENRNGER